MISKIELQIDQDWNPLIQKFNYLKKILANFPEEKAKYIEGYKSYRYDFGDSGSIIFYDILTSTKKTASGWSGKLVENFLPWISRLKTDLSDLNLVAIGIQENLENLSIHADGQESSTTVKHCKLNYIIDDYTDVTYVRDNHNNINNYCSTKNTAWLIDTTKPHWTENNTKPRYIFQLTFHQDFDEVNQWFKQKGKLYYN
jgi:hypothetical protein